MELMTEPVTALPGHSAETFTATDWLDSLASGECDRAAFLRGVSELLRRAPDTGWELLALVDQYYRRGKINAEAFADLKAHLQSLVMGGPPNGISIPLLRPQTPQMATLAPKHATPAATTVATPAATTVATPVSPIAPSAPTSAPISMPRGFASQRSTSVPVTGPTDFASSTSLAGAPVAESTERPQRALTVGDVLRGRYRVMAILGQGGMGTVFEAVDEFRLDRSHGDQKVAIKVLHTAVIQRPRLFAELRREFQHLQSLSHPNIVRVHEFDRDGDLAFFTMEYLSGALLTRVLGAHVASPLVRSDAFALIRDIGAAIAHAHDRGVAHGDLNPGNIFITDGGEVRVLDFGASHPLRRSPWISEFESSRQVTVATPTYASCQLLEGETADGRDDIYAMACIAYVLLTGNHPFREHSALKARTLRMTPTRPRSISRRQWHALRAGLHFERDRRPSDVRAWLAELGSRSASAHLPILPALLATRPANEAHRTWVWAAAAAALIAACAWWGSTHVASLIKVQQAVRAKLNATFQNTSVSRSWDRYHDAVARSQETTPQAAATAEPAPQTPEVVRNVSEEPLPAAPAASAQTGPRAIAPRPITPQSLELRSVTSIQRPPPASPPAILQAATALPLTGHARIELASDNVEVAASDAMAHVLVRRTRSMRGDVSFNWWTESGTAKPGRDFVTVKSQVEHIPDGKNSVDLFIPIVLDPGRRDARSFYVVIDAASDNASLGPRTLSMITIPEPE